MCWNSPMSIRFFSGILQADNFSQVYAFSNVTPVLNTLGYVLSSKYGLLVGFSKVLESKLAPKHWHQPLSCTQYRVDFSEFLHLEGNFWFQNPSNVLQTPCTLNCIWARVFKTVATFENEQTYEKLWIQSKCENECLGLGWKDHPGCFLQFFCSNSSQKRKKNVEKLLESNLETFFYPSNAVQVNSSDF